MHALLISLLLAQTAAQPAAVIREVSLQGVANRSLGFTIDIPAAAQSRGCDQERCTLAATLARGGEIIIVVSRVAADAGELSYLPLSADGGIAVYAEDEKLPGEHRFILLAPREGLQEAWFFAKTRDGLLSARCVAPVRLKSACVKIVRSLRGMSLPQSAPAGGDAGQRDLAGAQL